VVSKTDTIEKTESGAVLPPGDQEPLSYNALGQADAGTLSSTSVKLAQKTITQRRTMAAADLI
jgi:hypothetical protein